MLTLQILNARPDDQGTYTVRAVNPVGSDETTCKLTVKPEPKKGPGAPPEQAVPLEVKAPQPKKEDLDQMEPPKVIVPLEHEKVKKGTPVLLKATITGKPTPTVSLLYDRAGVT
jgi:Immunoglobulin I-set domain